MSICIVLVDLATGERHEYDRDESIYEALLDWARFHGIDPNTVPAGSELVRDPDRCRVLYETFVYEPPEAFGDTAAMVVVENEPATVGRVSQGEAPPLPFPGR